MGTTERREREKLRRKNEIIDAAERIFFSKGLDQSTMDDVAAEAELSKGTLYLYFKSKEELYLAINERGFRILQKLFADAISKEQNGLDKIRAIGQAYFEFAQKYADYFNAMLYYESRDIDFSDKNSCAQACEKVGTETLKIVAEAIQTGILDGSIRPDVDPFKTAVVLWGQSSGIVQVHSLKGQHLKEKHAIKPEEIMRVFMEMMSRSLQA